MIVIRHKETGEPLLEVAADTLAGADLEGAMLLCAEGADLRGAHLRVVDLCQADLREATLDGADLRDADVTLANLVGATLRGADLTDARFQGINMGTEGPGLTDFTGAERPMSLRMTDGRPRNDDGTTLAGWSRRNRE